MNTIPDSAAARRRSKAGSYRRQALSALLVTGVLVSLLMRKTSVAEIVVQISQMDGRFYLLGGLVYLLANLVKAMRFRQTTESGSRKIRFWEYFEVTAIYNMATGLLPFGTGEISYPYLMKRGHDVRVTQSASTLLVTRLADLISISLLFFVAILLLSDDLIVSGDVMLMIGGVLLIASLCLAFAPWVGDRLLDILEQWSTRLLGTARSGLAARVFQAGRHFVVRMRAIVIRPRELAGLFFYSFTIWLLCYWFFQLILYGLGYPFTFWMAAFSGSLVLLTNLLPVPAIAGLGVRQIGWLLALVAMGFDTEEAVTLGFSVHLISLSYMILLGLSGLGSLFVRQMILNGKA